MCQQVQSLQRHLGTVDVFPQHLTKHEENFSHLASEVQAMRQQQKEILSDISNERNRTSHLRRAETSAREQELNTLSFQLNSTKADFVQLVEITNRTINKMLQQEINTREHELDMLSFRLNNTKEDFYKLNVATSRELKDIWSERLGSLETKTNSRLQSQEKEVKQENSMLSLLSRELNRTSHMLRAETNAREQELSMLSFQLNSTKADFIQLVEATNRTLNKKRNERLASLETKIISRLQSQEKKVTQLQDQQMQANASISALKKVSLLAKNVLLMHKDGVMTDD